MKYIQKVKENMKKIIIQIFIIIGVLYIYFCFFLFFYQKNFIFFPSQLVSKIPDNLNIEEVYFTTNDNIKLHWWYLDNNSEKTVLFFHWNAWNISHRIQQIEVFNDLKLNALIFDFREYWKSEWKIEKEVDLYNDWLASLDFLVNDKNVELSNLIIWWRSLWWAIAINTAQNKNVYATIIESTFYSMDYMASKQYPIFPTKLLLKYHLRSDLKINNIKSKLLIIHSIEDEMIPFKNWLKLFDIFNWDKQFLEISWSHNYGFIKSHSLYLESVKIFLNL